MTEAATSNDVRFVSEEALSRVYRSYGETHSDYVSTSAGGSPGKRAHQRSIVDRFFPQDTQARVVDIGCGDGSLVEIATLAGYRNTVGIDASPSMISLARARVAETGSVPGENLILQDALSYLQSVPPESLDMVVAIDVLEHLPLEGILNMLDAVRIALAPSGALLLHVPNGSSPLSGGMLYGDVTHFRAFTPQSVAQLGRVTGFSSIDSFEDPPVRSSGTAVVRSMLWKVVRLFWAFLLAIETGQSKGHVLTVNMFGVLKK